MNSAAILAISIDQSFCITGGDVTGRVYLAIQRDYLPADALVLYLIGEECTTVQEINETRGASRFLEETWALADYAEGRIARGHYEFPIQILIPPLLPSSLKIKSGREGCTIQYYLEARLYEDSEMEHFISSKKKLIIKSQHIQFSSSPLTIPLIRENLHGNWCSQVGSILMGLYTPHSTLSPLNVFQISFIAFPLCGTEQIQTIDIAIVESITWRTRSPQPLFRQHEVLLWQTSLQPKDLPDIEIDLSRIELLGYNEIDEATRQFFTNYLRSLHFSVSALIRKDAYPTIKGRLISIQHYIRLRVNTPFRVPELCLPIRIQFPPEIRQSVSSAYLPLENEFLDIDAGEAQNRPRILPEDWSPVVVEPVYLSRSAIHLIVGSERPSIASSAYRQAEEVDLAVLPVDDQSYRIDFME